jgi:pyrimidine-nucleoside phosphorylase
VMSKKLAGGAEAILLDVKTGSGAFMEDLEGARKLAELCVALGEEGGRAAGALITDMGQPLADAVGNSIEVSEAIEVLRGERSGRFAELCVTLAGHMAVLAGLAGDADEGAEKARDALGSGAALERFRRFVEAQGGDPRVVEDESLLPQAPVRHEVKAGRDGWLEAVDAEEIGHAAARVGAGRLRKGDEIDLAVGLHFLAEIGDEANPETVVAVVLANDQDAAHEAAADIQAALSWSEEPVDRAPVVHEVVGERLK